LSKLSNYSGTLRALGVPAEPGSIYELALTHRSFAFEHPEPLPHNERLEFLGDAVLDLIVTDLIFRAHPSLAEGDMAKLRASVVNKHALADLARLLELGDHIKLGRGEEASGGRNKDSLLADTLEAVFGAVYLDRGLATLRTTIEPLFGGLVADAVRSGGGHDPKTALQEVAVRDRGGRPSYRVASSGPDHDKRFVAHVYVGDELFGVGSGRSKKEAEQKAAREALGRLSEVPVEEILDAPAAPEGERDARAS
jgi:ribonuclease-3